MRLRSPHVGRRAAALAEAAIVYPVALLLTVGVITVALGVYSYQQTGALAREGTRWASTHGGQYQQEMGNSMATQATVLSHIQAMAAGLDTTKLTCTVTWDDSSEMPVYLSAGAEARNYVTVTVTYEWAPPLYLGSMTLQSKSVMMMQY